MKKSKRIMSLLFTTIIVLGMIFATGCSSKSKALDPASSLVLTIGDSKVYLNELMYYIYAVEAEGDYYDQMYQQYFNESYWDMEYAEGVTMRDQTKQYIIDTAIMYEVLHDKAVENGYTLTEDEIAEAKNNAETIISSVSKEQLEITGFTSEVLSNVQQKLMLGEKYYSEVIEGLDINEEEITASIKYEDYRQYDTEFLFVPTTTYDETNNLVDLSEEEIKTAKESIDKALEKVKAGDDFATIVEADPLIETTELSFVYGDGTIESGFQDAAILLENDEITDTVIEAETGYYIIKMINNDSKVSYEAAIADAIASEEETQFNAIYEEILKLYETEVNNTVWDAIKMGETTIVASASTTTATE